MTSGTRPPGWLRSRWELTARLIAEHRDLLDERPCAAAGEPPRGHRLREWAPSLLALRDSALDAIETDGVGAWREVPRGLRDLAERAHEVSSLPSLAMASAPTRALRQGETPRKRAQIDAFGRLVAPLAPAATRVVDVGSGHGHLTRDLAELLKVPALGLERDATLAARARSLSAGTSPTFATTDVLREGLAFGHGDCVVGLHACGELGDVLAASVARARGSMLALVGCCPQKRRQASRRPLVPLPGAGDALDLPRAVLGLGNLAASDHGVEASRAENLLARERRLALHRLLAERVGPLRLGAELDGLNRRMAHRDLPHLVARAFALRGLPAPSTQAVVEAGQWARVEHAKARRLSVPRSLLARPLEVYVLLDRALHLEVHGLDVRVGELFPASISPRNLALVAA